MERLTFDTNLGHGIYKIDRYHSQTIMPSDIHKKCPEYFESIINAFNLLAAYEVFLSI